MYICDICHEFCLFGCFVFLQFLFLIFPLISTNYTIKLVLNFPIVYFFCLTFALHFFLINSLCVSKTEENQEEIGYQEWTMIYFLGTKTEIKQMKL